MQNFLELRVVFVFLFSVQYKTFHVIAYQCVINYFSTVLSTVLRKAWGLDKSINVRFLFSLNLCSDIG
jgi:hypothetical protein